MAADPFPYRLYAEQYEAADKLFEEGDRQVHRGGRAARSTKVVRFTFTNYSSLLAGAIVQA